MSNALNEGLTGKHIVIEPEFFRLEYQGIEHRVALATGGFGCSPATSGTAVFVEGLLDGEKYRIEGYNVERFATPGEVKYVKGLRAARGGD